MAASMSFEEETGTYTRRHPHNGYYAGDFSQSEKAETAIQGPYDERRPW